jgi:hypothetical protein
MVKDVTPGPSVEAYVLRELADWDDGTCCESTDAYKRYDALNTIQEPNRRRVSAVQGHCLPVSRGGIAGWRTSGATKEWFKNDNGS